MIAQANVTTERGTKYLKTLCGHFRLKVEAQFDDERGHVNFPFGRCDLHTTPDGLHLRIEADSPEAFDRLKDVVGGHLERFAVKEGLQVHWQDVPQPTA